MNADNTYLNSLGDKVLVTQWGHGCKGYLFTLPYVVEFALKACIAKRTKRHDFPDITLNKRVFTHDLTELLELADLSYALAEEGVRNPPIRVYWYAVSNWREQSRYETPDEFRAREIFLAVTDKKHGVLRWLSHYW